MDQQIKKGKKENKLGCLIKRAHINQSQSMLLWVQGIEESPDYVVYMWSRYFSTSFKTCWLNP